MNKADRLQYGESQMTHAMLFTGVDLDKMINLLNGE
jgi:bleomycin hydrolase